MPSILLSLRPRNATLIFCFIMITVVFFGIQCSYIKPVVYAQVFWGVISSFGCHNYWMVHHLETLILMVLPLCKYSAARCVLFFFFLNYKKQSCGSRCPVTSVENGHSKCSALYQEWEPKSGVWASVPKKIFLKVDKLPPLPPPRYTGSLVNSHGSVAFCPWWTEPY